jgi:glycosyltransferase involved in cell wall biosynthesis
MRILAVSLSFPLPINNGYRIRVWSLLETLAAEGNAIHLLAFGEPAELEGYRKTVRTVCQTAEVVPHGTTSLSSGTDYRRRLIALFSKQPYGVARFRSPVMASRIKAWLREGSIDAVLCEEPYALVNFPSFLPVPLIVDSQNLEHVVIDRYLTCEPNPTRRAYAWLESQKLKAWEQQAWSRASLVMACSEHDQRIIAKICPHRPVVVVPNVVNVGDYHATLGSNSLTVLFTGGMDWYPNRDAVEFFTSAVLPKLRSLVPGVEFVVAGRSPSERFRRHFAEVPDVKFTGTVPDMRAELAKAPVCVVPLRIGSGTRLKILEAAAMAKPVVSTRVGAEGLEFVDGKEIVLADEPRAFAQAVAGFLNDASRRHTVGCAARRRVEQQYSLPVLRKAVRHALALLAQSLIGGSKPESTARLDRVRA